MYAPMVGTEDDNFSLVESYIYEMVACMLKHYPLAASRVFSGYRGQYTALHSAVFHGRYTDTINLILQTEAAHPSEQRPCLLGNTQGEVPLHFCAMRGERPRSVALIAKAAPQAVLKRDSSGLTPFHWLWIRYVGNLLALDEGGRGSDSTIRLRRPNLQGPPFETNQYNEFTSLEQGDFDGDQLIRRMDPPVDFLRMRHIPVEVHGDATSHRWADQTSGVLRSIRSRHATRDPDADSSLWTRQEVITSLFWTKAVSLLEATQVTCENAPRRDSFLVHKAYASPCCVPAVCRVASSLFPDELTRRDEAGRLPIHHAASRNWHAWDWPRDGGLNEPTAAKLLEKETLRVLQTALDVSPPEALRLVDNEGRLVLHHVIETFVKACSLMTCSESSQITDMLDVLTEILNLYPGALQRRDGVSKLFPFLQATSSASRENSRGHSREDASLSVAFLLLRYDPTVLAS